MSDFSARHKAVYDLAAQGYDWAQIAVRLQTPKQTCQRYYRRAVLDDGLPELPELPVSGKRREPGAEASREASPGMPAVIGPTAHEVDALKEACKRAGVKASIVTALVKRLQAGDPNVSSQAKRMSTPAEFIEAFQDRLSMVLGYVDDYALANASVKDLAIAAGIFTEKMLLLKGQPTQIIDFTTRQQLHVLAPRLLAEAKRRGITIDGQSSVVSEPVMVGPA